MAAALYALFHAANIGILTTEALTEISIWEVDKEAYADSCMPSSVVSEICNRDDHRILVEEFLLKESYKKRKLKGARWEDGKENGKDVLPKEMSSTKLGTSNLIKKNRL